MLDRERNDYDDLSNASAAKQLDGFKHSFIQFKEEQKKRFHRVVRSCSRVVEGDCLRWLHSSSSWFRSYLDMIFQLLISTLSEGLIEKKFAFYICTFIHSTLKENSKCSLMKWLSQSDAPLPSDIFLSPFKIFYSKNYVMNMNYVLVVIKNLFSPREGLMSSPPPPLQSNFASGA